MGGDPHQLPFGEAVLAHRSDHSSHEPVAPRLGQSIADLGLVAHGQAVKADVTDQGIAFTDGKVNRFSVSAGWHW